jgi:hypothetical protein
MRPMVRQEVGGVLARRRQADRRSSWQQGRAWPRFRRAHQKSRCARWGDECELAQGGANGAREPRHLLLAHPCVQGHA